MPIVGAGLPTPELQVEIRTGGGLVGVVDAWFDDAAVAVEFDGRVKDTDPWRERDAGQVLWEEKRREDALRARDVQVVRIAGETSTRDGRALSSGCGSCSADAHPPPAGSPRHRGCGASLGSAESCGAGASAAVRARPGTRTAAPAAVLSRRGQG